MWGKDEFAYSKSSNSGAFRTLVLASGRAVLRFWRKYCSVIGLFFLTAKKADQMYRVGFELELTYVLFRLIEHPV